MTDNERWQGVWPGSHRNEFKMDRSTKRGTVLVVGATGSVGRRVVAEAVHQGYKPRALVRDTSRARRLDSAAEKVVGELTRTKTLADAVADIDASGNAYTIVRPGWFDYNDDDQVAIAPLQGDTRHAGSSADGVIAAGSFDGVRDQANMPLKPNRNA